MCRSGWVDVRDTALAHVLAIQKEAAGGQRILVNSGKWVWQDWGTFFIITVQCDILLTRGRSH